MLSVYSGPICSVSWHSRAGSIVSVWYALKQLSNRYEEDQITTVCLILHAVVQFLVVSNYFLATSTPPFHRYVEGSSSGGNHTAGESARFSSDRIDKQGFL